MVRRLSEAKMAYAKRMERKSAPPPGVASEGADRASAFGEEKSLGSIGLRIDCQFSSAAELGGRGRCEVNDEFV